ncbi:MAG: mandelate racemase [Chloroflexi bacterium]|nr:mandelate racemase [Chloroflexota bacterium]
MKIVDLRWTHALVPLEAPLRSADGVGGAALRRTILEVETDDGLVGLGEIGRRVPSDRLQAARAAIVGRSPFDLERLRLELHGTRFYQLDAAILAAGVEMACLDIQGKATGRPVSDLLGGALREEVPAIAYVFRRLASEGQPAVDTSDDLVKHVQRLVERHGFQTIKLKGGAAPPEDDVEAILALRSVFPRHKLRLDPNGAWTVATSLRVAALLRDADLEWLEDPTFGIDGMAEVTARSPIATATNMCLIDFHELGAAVRRRATDVMLLDVFFLGGLRAAKAMAMACGAFGIDVGIHSGGSGGAELGIALAAMLHLASTIPTLRCAIDAIYHQYRDDVIAGGPFVYHAGALPVPTGPGLGVSLDPERVARYAEAAERQRREAGGRREPDLTRPGWFPTYPAY